MSRNFLGTWFCLLFSFYSLFFFFFHFFLFFSFATYFLLSCLILFYFCISLFFSFFFLHPLSLICLVISLSQQERHSGDTMTSIFVAGTRPISHRFGRSVRRSVGLSHFAFLAFLGILRVGKFVFENAPAQSMTAPAQIITAPAQIIIAPAHRPRQEQSCIRPCWE